MCRWGTSTALFCETNNGLIYPYVVLLEWPRSFPGFPLSVQFTMNGAELEANSPTADPALSGNSGDLEKEVQASDVADNLETMQITEEEPSNQPEANENVTDDATAS